MSSNTEFESTASNIHHGPLSTTRRRSDAEKAAWAKANKQAGGVQGV